MKWAIIVLIMMSLIGSMMWVMPSPRQRFLAKLRQQASRMGFHVQLARITPPRGEGQIEAETVTATAYRLPRTGLDKQAREQFKEWQVYRLKSIANEGLPEGWSWGKGERQMTAVQLAELNKLIDNVPAGVSAIESTPVHLTLFWDEKGDESTLDVLHGLMQPVMKLNF